MGQQSDKFDNEEKINKIMTLVTQLNIANVHDYLRRSNHKNVHAKNIT